MLKITARRSLFLQVIVGQHITRFWVQYMFFLKPQNGFNIGTCIYPESEGADNDPRHKNVSLVHVCPFIDIIHNRKPAASAPTYLACIKNMLHALS